MIMMPQQGLANGFNDFTVFGHCRAAFSNCLILTAARLFIKVISHLNNDIAIVTDIQQTVNGGLFSSNATSITQILTSVT
jgi:hypothetical protein